MAVKEKIGIVISYKMTKTRVVSVVDRLFHKHYKKLITRTKRYKVHDPTNSSIMGSKVRISSCRPISKTKTWKITLVFKNKEKKK